MCLIWERKASEMKAGNSAQNPSIKILPGIFVVVNFSFEMKIY